MTPVFAGPDAEILAAIPEASCHALTCRGVGAVAPLWSTTKYPVPASVNEAVTIADHVPILIMSNKELTGGVRSAMAVVVNGTLMTEPWRLPVLSCATIYVT